MHDYSGFKAAWWLSNCHLQTLYPTLFRRLKRNHEVRRERLVTPDHDFLDIDYYGQVDKTLVILLHGLTGSSQSHYIQAMQVQLAEQGFATVALNFRGCSGDYNNLARCYHSGETEDIHFLYQTLRQQYPDTALAVVGFSLGGNVLLKWLGEQQDKIDLFAACAVSVPLLLSECANKLDAGFSKIYRNSLIAELKQYITCKYRHLEQCGFYAEAEKIRQLGDLSSIKSFWQYDDRVVARLHGFKNAEDYYQKSSSIFYLNKITIPSLLIQALDDPFMTSSVIPERSQFAETMTLELLPKGGHVGFVCGSNPFKPLYWLDKRIVDFISCQFVSLKCV